jgi:hypothetical protein
MGTAMERLSELLVLMLELIARILTPAAKRRLAEFANNLLVDVPLIEGFWAVEFQDSLPARGTQSTMREIDAHLTQFGRKIQGRGHLHGESSDEFHFRGIIRRDIFLGQYQRKNLRILGGVGSFVLKIDGLSKTMTGKCLWYEGTDDQVWHSEYRWKRVNG